MSSLEEVLSGLKPFQRATVDYVADQFLAGRTRFLVADEVGLGKTKIANGVMARLMHARDKGQAADILYVCSNSAIARKNLKELKAVKSDQQEATRLTLLAHPQSKLGRGEQGVNLISLTPGTSFHAASGTGWAAERAFVRNILMANGPMDYDGLDKLLQRDVSDASWARHVQQSHADLDHPAVRRFLDIVRGGPLGEEVARFELNERPAQLIGRLRHALALSSIQSLHPAFIIFDEFQRFSELFGTTVEGEVEAKAMARELMDTFLAHEHGPAQSKVLFVSATPYRMLSVHDDDPTSGDHHREFLQVIETLYGSDRGPEMKRQLLEDFSAMRRALIGYRPRETDAELTSARNKVQTPLRQVIARTERVDPKRPNAGIERITVPVEITVSDLKQAKAAHEVARKVQAPRIVEFWKSAPYLFSFMGQYTLNKKVAEHANLTLEKVARPALFRKPSPANTKPIDFGNGRMRALADKVLDQDALHRRLWLPPSLPYVKGDDRPLTKTLIFSAWQVAPEAIAGLISLEAERRLRRELDDPDTHHPRGDDRRQALRFALDAQHARTSLQAFALLWPSTFLSQVVDPMALWREHGQLDPDAMLELAKAAIKNAWPQDLKVSDQTDPWELIARLDQSIGQPVSIKSIKDRLGPVHKRSGGMNPLIDRFAKSDGDTGALEGAEPSEDTIDYLARLALGSPAICARRSLVRLGAGNPDGDAALLADGMVSMYNKPELGPLRARGGQTGWQNFLDIALRDDLQAVLDEYLFVLNHGQPPQSDAIDRAAAALRMPNAKITLYNPFSRNTGRKAHEGSLTSHLAVRFAANVTRDDNHAEDASDSHRIDTLLDAFNSPFRPFVLASTSVGQEGLDFHKYCHRLWHWNLPSNPVDLEQREGRIQRFMGHAVRLNMAQAAGDAAQTSLDQPWRVVTKTAEQISAQNSKKSGPEGLEPYWIFDGDAKVESIIPVPPMSRDAELAERVQRNIANYRLAFGQARQDDLMRVIGQLGPEEADLLREIGLIDLRPRGNRASGSQALLPEPVSER